MHYLGAARMRFIEFMQLVGPIFHIKHLQGVVAIEEEVYTRFGSSPHSLAEHA